MYVTRLGYVGIEAPGLDAWHDFFGPLLGADVTVEGGAVVTRVDEWARRFIVTEGDASDVSFIGWEVPDAVSFARQIDLLAAHNPESLTEAELALRQVTAGAWCLDPAGTRVEIFHGPVAVAELPARETTFVTGDLGLGHVVLSVEDLASSRDFYERELGFRLSDCAKLGDVELAFLRCNPRHHSLALATTAAGRHCEHLMLQVSELDAVGRAYDRCRDAEVAQAGLGRHSNDHMFSFYAITPAGFTFEYGFGGDEIHGSRHVPSVFARESAWGHETLIPVTAGA